MEKIVTKYILGISVLILILASLTILGYQKQQLPIEEIPYTAEYQTINFPEDEYQHSTPVEWWYYSGHLISTDESKYGFHVTIFKGRSQTGFEGYMAHVSLTDLENHIHHQSSRILIPKFPGRQNDISFNKDDWDIQLNYIDNMIIIDSPLYKLKLDLTNYPRTILHNKNGYIANDTGWTYYYSHPDLAVRGHLTLDGKEMNVSGTVWMDHQWGDFAVPGYPAGWQWFSILLPDNEYLMISESRNSSNESELYGTLLESNGQALHLTDNEISLTILNHWVSPETKAEYPIRWSLKIESAGINIIITPDIINQEITTAFPPQTIYWEGSSSYKGSVRNQSTTGKSYVELVGYVITDVIIPTA